MALSALNVWPVWAGQEARLPCTSSRWRSQQPDQHVAAQLVIHQKVEDVPGLQHISVAAVGNLLATDLLAASECHLA